MTKEREDMGPDWVLPKLSDWVLPESPEVSETVGFDKKTLSSQPVSNEDSNERKLAINKIIPTAEVNLPMNQPASSPTLKKDLI